MNGIGVLELDRVTFRYGSRTVLADLSLTFSPGVNVLLGRNGAGKTTLMRVLAGAASPAAGEVRLNGRPSGRRGRTRRRVLRDIGWLPQAFGFPPGMTTREFVAYAAWLKEVPRQHIAERVGQALRLVHLDGQATQPLRALSGGQLRRAGLAAAMAADPGVLVLDEPTAGLDPEQRDSFHDFIRGSREDKVVVVATHLLEDVDAVAERVAVLDEGAVCWAGTPGELAAKGGAAGLDGLRRGFLSVIGAGR